MEYPDFSKLDELIEMNKQPYLCYVCKRPTISNLGIEDLSGVSRLLCSTCWILIIMSSKPIANGFL